MTATTAPLLLPITETTSRGRTIYRARVDAAPDPTTGKRRQVSRTFRTYDDAAAWVTTARADAAAGRAPREPETVRQLVARHLASSRSTRATTRARYADQVRTALGIIGDRRVVDVTVQDVERLTDQLLTTNVGQYGKPYAPGTVRNVLAVLSGAFTRAEREGTIPRSPVRYVERPALDYRHSSADVWTDDQAARFVEHVRTRPDAALWLLAVLGLRRSEVLGLRWEDVNQTDGTVHVHRGRTRLYAVAVEAPTKSTVSRRLLPVLSVLGLGDALVELHAAQLAAAVTAGRPAPVYVATEPDGDPTVPDVYSRRFARLCRAAGVPVIHLHNTRHTAASLLLAAGFPPVDVAAWLGHSVEVLLSRYARALPGGAAAIADTLHARYGAA